MPIAPISGYGSLGGAYANTGGHKLLIAPVCIGSITGFGWHSYGFGLRALIKKLNP